MFYDKPKARLIIGRCPRSLRFNFFKLVFLKENTRPFEAKFHMKPQWDFGMEMFSNVPSYMTKKDSAQVHMW